MSMFDMKNLSDTLGGGNSNLYMVDHENSSIIIQEYEEAIESADKLCEVYKLFSFNYYKLFIHNYGYKVIDEESKPYESKYKARAILDQIIAKLEATRTIASLEKKR